MYLRDEKIIQLKAETKPLNNLEIENLHPAVANWEIIEIAGILHLRRSFKFDDFVQALAFTNRVGELANLENHHPAILTEYGMVMVTWWTHKIHGLHRNDFIMAAKTNALFEGAKK